MTLIEQMRNHQMNIHPYNLTVTSSPLGEEWVRVFSYSCIMGVGEPTDYQDYIAEELWNAFKLCHTEEELSHVVWYSGMNKVTETRPFAIEMPNGGVVVVTATPVGKQYDRIEIK